MRKLLNIRLWASIGVLVSWIGWTILSIAGTLWLWKTWRSGRVAVPA